MFERLSGDESRDFSASWSRVARPGERALARATRVVTNDRPSWIEKNFAAVVTGTLKLANGANACLLGRNFFLPFSRERAFN